MTTVAGVVAFAAWFACGQPLGALRDYVATLPEFAGPYPEAMLWLGERPWVIGAAAMALAVGMIGAGVLASSALRVQGARPAAVVVLLMLVMASKGAFVRADATHLPVAFGCVVLAPVVVAELTGRLPRWPMSVVVGALAVSSLGLVGASSMLRGSARAVRVVPAMVRGHVGASGFDRRYEQQMAVIRSQVDLPAPPSEPVDLYTSDVSAVLAQGWAWSPRPTLQSYAALSDQLAARNADHLVGPRAPQSLYVKLRPIDHRWAMLEDAATWTRIMALFERVPTDTSRTPFMVLRRRDIPLGISRSALTARGADFGQWLTIDASARVVEASFNYRSTVARTLQGAVFAPSRLWIEVELDDGSRYRRRWIPSMSGTGVVISPMIERTTDLAALVPGGERRATRAVRRFRLVGGAWSTWTWGSTYDVRMQSVEFGLPVVATP